MRRCHTLLVLVAVLTHLLPAHAGLTFVDCDGGCDYLTIQEGLNATESGDTVYVMDGVYAGPSNCNLDFHGKAISLLAHEYPTSDTVIDCETEARAFLFDMDDSEGPVIQGFIIRNGRAPDGQDGGAVKCQWQSRPSFYDCRFENCQAYEGGAVYHESLVGGGEATFVRCVFENNRAESASGYGRGGAIGAYSSAHVYVTDCVFEGNSAQTEGGAIWARAASVPVSGSWFLSNEATSGGAIKLNGPLADGTQVVQHSTFVGNTAGNGGAMSTVMSVGGAVIDHCTLVWNAATGSGGGIYASGESAGTITNTVIAFSQSGEAFAGLTVLNADHCCSFGNAGGDTLPSNGDNLYVDPLLCKQGDPEPCDNSPCLPPGNPWGEYIGAHSTGCPPCTGTGVAEMVEEVSWGAIKALFD
jgi:predicted outer membrane repeat protein